MTFLHPEFIYLMLPVLLILFGLLLTQSDQQELIFSPESLAKLRVDVNQLSAKTRNLFYFLMFLFIILALAGPVIEKGSAKVKIKEKRYFVALDISDSMLCEDVYPNRLELGKQKIVELLQKDKKSSIGLLTFANSSYLVASPSFDHQLLTFLIKPMNSSYSSEHGTNILNLLKATAKLLEGNEEKNLFIVSDGGDKRRFTEEITYAKKEGIRVYILSIGTSDGGMIPQEGGVLQDQGQPVISRVNRAIENLATASGGAVVQADDLLAFLASMDVESMEKDEKPIYFYLFIVPLGLAMLMFLIATSSFYRGEKYYLPSFAVLTVMCIYPPSIEAGLFDYQRLERADAAYKQEDYRKSAKNYESYALEHESVEAAYNAANGYYKMGRYEMAAGLYSSIYFVEADKNYQLFHNLGNALAKSGSTEKLKKAILAYEKALKFKEEKETIENLKAVRKALENRTEDKKRAFQQQAATGRSKTVSTSKSKKSASQKEKGLSDVRRAMSDMEAKKWLKVLQKRQHAQAYKIEVAEPNVGVDSAKPW